MQIGLSSWHWTNGIFLRRPKSKSDSYFGVKRNFGPKRGGKQGELAGTSTCFKCIPKGWLVVATLTLGSRPRQRGCKGAAKKKPGSHITYSQECRKVWGSEPSHSQGNSHSKTPETSERNFKGQNSMAFGVLYIIGNLLERKCLKWARISHLDI